MGHVARAIEEAGIPTVVVAVQAFERRIGVMTLPRLLLTPNLMGRPLGAPFDQESHRDIILVALNLLETAVAVGTIERFKRP